MSFFLAAAAACEQPSVFVETPTDTTAASMRLRLEESLRHSLEALRTDQRRDVHIERRMQERALREAERFVEQRVQHERLLREMEATRAACADSPVEALPDAPNLDALDVFQRLKAEEERRRRMQLPQSGIAALYNASDSGTEVEPLPRLLEAGAKIAALEGSVRAQNAFRTHLRDSADALTEWEASECDAASNELLARRLARHEEINRIEGKRLGVAAAAPEQSTPLEHPIDVYHRMVRDAMGICFQAS